MLSVNVLKKEEIHSIILPDTRLPGIGLIQRLFRIHPCHFQFAISTSDDNRKGLSTPHSKTNGYKHLKKGPWIARHTFVLTPSIVPVHSAVVKSTLPQIGLNKLALTRIGPSLRSRSNE